LRTIFIKGKHLSTLEGGGGTHKHPSLANMLVNEKKLTSNLVIKQHDIKNVAKVFPMKPLLPQYMLQ
jgi:hypothetical protein